MVSDDLKYLFVLTLYILFKFHFWYYNWVRLNLQVRALCYQQWLYNSVLEWLLYEHNVSSMKGEEYMFWGTLRSAQKGTVTRARALSCIR